MSAPAAGAGPRVLIAGGGVAALEALLAVRELLGEAARIELLSPSREFVYKPLAVGEPFGLSTAVDFDLAAIADGNGAELRHGALRAVDPERRVALTREGDELAYDHLVVATGARMREWLPGALHFAGLDAVGELRDLLSDIETGEVPRLAFVVSSGPAWVLPLYELALLTHHWLVERGTRRGEQLVLVTSEDAPLEAFGTAASARVAELLAERGIELHTGHHVAVCEPGRLVLVPEDEVAAERCVTLPRAVGEPLEGLPHDPDGFLVVDEHGRVEGVERVYGAGDGIDFPVKQGGLAAQQADAAAEALAADAGAELEPTPFEPVLYGALITGERPEFLSGALSGGHGETSRARGAPLWWPPGKIAGRRLGPYLASIADHELEPPGD